MRGFVRTSVAVPVVTIGDAEENARRTITIMQQAQLREHDER